MRLNIAPAISPDGGQVVFLSAKDLFSVDVYLADTRTGKIKRKLTETAMDPHLESIQLVNSAGDWSPDGKRFVFAAVSKGKAVLRILDMSDGRMLDEIRVAEADEIFNPTWSPDGKSIAFSAMRGGVMDLFTLDLQGRSVRSLTGDVYADLHPAWSPDGRRIAFVTDRFHEQCRRPAVRRIPDCILRCHFRADRGGIDPGSRQADQSAVVP